MRRPNVSVADGMISAVLNVVVRASDDERDHALRWAERRLSKSSLPQYAAAALLDGLRRADKRKGGARPAMFVQPDQIALFRLLPLQFRGSARSDG